MRTAALLQKVLDINGERCARRWGLPWLWGHITLLGYAANRSELHPAGDLKRWVTLIAGYGRRGWLGQPGWLERVYQRTRSRERR